MLPYPDLVPDTTRAYLLLTVIGVRRLRLVYSELDFRLTFKYAFGLPVSQNPVQHHQHHQHPAVHGRQQEQVIGPVQPGLQCR